MARGDLFAEIEPYQSGYLPVSYGHSIYFEQVGNPEGRPALFLHGGPGAGAGAVHRRFFDPAYWRLVVFDQRGAGRSRPQGGISGNSTGALIGDIEALREHLGIESWLLFGGSWGSTLGLAYAQSFPERVTAMVLRGIFLGRPEEVHWFLHGLAQVFPDAHAAFAGHLPEAERADLLASYLVRLTDPDPAVHLPASRAWSVYEGTCSTLLPTPISVAGYARDRATVGLARIEAHYFANALFLPPEGLLARMDRLAGLRAEIVQGRYDMICPTRSAWQLAERWPGAKLSIIPDAGHSALEPGIRRALVAAVEAMRDDR